MRGLSRAVAVVVVLLAGGGLLYWGYLLLFGPLDLQYKWKPGQKLTYVTETKASVEANTQFSEEGLADSLVKLLEKFSGRDIGSAARWLQYLELFHGSVAQDMTASLAPAEVTAAGASLNATVENLQLKISPVDPKQPSPGGISLSWDGSNVRAEGIPEKSLQDMLAKEIREELSQPFRLSVSPKGEATEKTYGTWTSLLAFFSGFPQNGPGNVFFVLPEKPVKRGETWTRTVSPAEAQPAPLRPIVQAPEPMTFTYRVTAVRFRGLHRIADIEYDCDYSGNFTPSFFGFNLLGTMNIIFSLSANGAAEFDISAGRLLSANEKQNMTLNLKLDVPPTAGLPKSGTMNLYLKVDAQRTTGLRL